MRTVIPVENQDVAGALRGFLESLLEQGVVEALLLPMETPSGTITPALVSDPALLAAAAPLAPVLPVNAATQAGKLSIHEPRAKIGAVLRSCEIRALVELTKLLQASLDDMLVISLDCAGAYDVTDYLEREARDGWRELYANPSTDSGLRVACTMCEKPTYEGDAADVVVELLGADLSQGIPLTVKDEVAAQLGLEPAEVETRRDQVVEELVQARTQVRDAEFAAIRERLDQEEIAGVFAACIRCHNCMTVCPICYCKTCIFKSPIFEHQPAQYLNWAESKGAYRLPADTMLFHMTRLNHMVTSCVGCGMCTSVCPSGLPVGLLFRAIGDKAQAVFEYEPGRSLDEPIPLITFKEDEWTEMGTE